MSIRLKDSISAPLSGNASTATTLQTARTINGTSFNGSANITTANWGTARTLTIGSTGKSVNGSGNVSWTLAEIGAAASSHTHNYAGSSSAGGAATSALACTGNAATATKLQTTRTLTVGNTGKSFDGSANVSWSLSEIGAAATSHTHNYAASPSAGGAANLVYLPRVTGSTVSANYQPGANRIEMKEFGNDCSNTPSAAWYHIMTGQGGDSNYNTQLALGMTTQAVYYRYRNSGTWGSWKQLAFTDSSISGNAATATKLQTARTINGTNFDGSGAITTANWGTARTITIGSTGKSVNGSGNISWSLSEIGAAAASHTHSYLPLSGGTLSGAVTVSGESRFHNGTYSDPWNGQSCAIKAAGNIASTGSILSNGKFILGSTPSMYGSFGYESSSNDVYIANAANNWLRLKTDKSLTYAGYKVYTSYQKPTASEVGALATTGGTLSGNLSMRNTSTVIGIQLYRGSSTANYTRFAQADESGNLRIENYSNNAVVADYVFANGNFSPRRGNPYLGYSTYRWGQIYSTIGSISTSDSKLKENIVSINRSEVKLLNNEPTSYDFYNYVKGTGVYTFNYKKEVSNDPQTWLGILADEIPDNIFNKVGMMSKTHEEYQSELLKQEEAKKILESTPCPLNDEDANNQLIEGTSYTYNELKYEAEKYIEEPIRMINSSSQIAMLQEVLSIALNKIEALEKEIKEIQK